MKERYLLFALFILGLLGLCGDRSSREALGDRVRINSQSRLLGTDVAPCFGGSRDVKVRCRSVQDTQRSVRTHRRWSFLNQPQNSGNPAFGHRVRKGTHQEFQSLEPPGVP